MSDYSYNDIVDAYSKIGARKDSCVFIESDLACLGIYEDMSGEHLPRAHLQALQKLIGKGGTIIVPTASESLRNTSMPFDINSTSSEEGVFSEIVRVHPDSLRSFHPFVSWSAIGLSAKEICSDTSRQAFGSETPMERMIQKDTLFISVGLHPTITCQTVHQAGICMGVPYRYVREYYHPVVREEKICIEPFYMYVWYVQSNIKKDYNKKIWSAFINNYEIREVKLGRGKIYSYSMKDFFRCSIDEHKRDMYVLLENEPVNKPYLKTM